MKTDRLKLVIVEDEEAHFRLMERTIVKDLPDALIYHFDDVESFIQRLNEIRFDVILVDYLMPGMNGIDLLEFLNRENIDTPVVMITGQGDENIAVKAMKSGAADYLVKSKDFFKLLPATIEKVVRKRDLKKSLRESERLNQLLMDSLPHPAMLIRTDRKVVAANRAARTAGATIGGYCWRDFCQSAYISDEDRSKLNDDGNIPQDGIKCAFCLADEAVSSQASMNAPEIRAFGRIWDAWWIPVEANLLLHYTIDITDIKQKEKEVRKQRDFVNSLIETAPAIILFLDTEGHIVRFNRYLQEISGYFLEEVKGKKWFDTLLPQHGRDPFRSLYGHVLHSTPVRGVVSPILTQRGDERHIEWHGIVIKDDNGMNIGVLSIGVDITERMRAQRALRKSEEKYRSIVETAGEGIWIFDENARTTFVNQQMAMLLGYEADEMLGRRLFEFTGPDLRRELEAHYEAHRKGVRESYDFRFLKKDGSDLWAIVNNRPLFDEDGQFVGSLGMLTDISVRQANEEALRESERELRFLSSKLLSTQEEERKRIARELHDGLSGSLSAIKMSLENASDQLDKCGVGPELLKTPIVWTQHLINEARRLMTELRPSLLDDVGLIATLQWFFRQFRTTYPGIHIEEDIRIEEEDIPEPLRIVIFRITQEALHNIAKYSKAEYVVFSLVNQDGVLELGIEDNGEGFDLESVLSNISETRGLGLTSMKERAELSGGSFTIQPVAGEGTTLRAIWPLPIPLSSSTNFS